MNETIEVIKRRRSIRKYKQDQIPAQALEVIMECALLAPNACLLYTSVLPTCRSFAEDAYFLSGFMVEGTCS